jgi:hypothetical protein
MEECIRYSEAFKLQEVRELEEGKSAAAPAPEAPQPEGAVPEKR